MAVQAVGGVDLASGAGALSAINVTAINAGSVGLVVLSDDTNYGDSIIAYVLKESGDAQSLPRVILPTVGTVGNKRWHMASVFNMARNRDTESYHQLSHDTDGIIPVGTDRAVKAYDGSGNQWIVGQKIINIGIPFIAPHTWETAVRTKWVCWHNESGMNFNITRVFCTASSSTGITLNEITSLTNYNVTNLIGNISIDSSGTGVFYKATQAASLSFTQVRSNRGFAIAFGTDTVLQGQVILQGYFREA